MISNNFDVVARMFAMLRWGVTSKLEGENGGSL
jgi:hypothetical protein